MLKVILFASVAAVLAVGVMLVGCSNQQPSRQTTAPSEASQDKPADTGHSRYADALAHLSLEDYALAEKQKTCPVCGQPLGSMGKPYKVALLDREVLLCCQGCEAKIKAKPDEYLAKLKQ